MLSIEFLELLEAGGIIGTAALDFDGHQSLAFYKFTKYILQNRKNL